MCPDLFLRIVEETGGISRTEAERAARATLRTLGERITGGEAEDIAGFLPPNLREALTAAPGKAEAFTLDEFIRRVARREGVDEAAALLHARAVFAALDRVLPEREIRDMAAQLPRDFEPVLNVIGSRADPGTTQVGLVQRVAELLGLSPRAARRAVEAVLETLAERISEGEVEDLMARLPAPLTPALERGLADHRRAMRMSLGEFLDRVARREGVSREQAQRHARAVFAALRDTVPRKEIEDVESELPREYSTLFATVV